MRNSQLYERRKKAAAKQARRLSMAHVLAPGRVRLGQTSRSCPPVRGRQGTGPASATFARKSGLCGRCTRPPTSHRCSPSLRCSLHSPYGTMQRQFEPNLSVHRAHTGQQNAKNHREAGGGSENEAVRRCGPSIGSGPVVHREHGASLPSPESRRGRQKLLITSCASYCVTTCLRKIQCSSANPPRWLQSSRPDVPGLG